MVSEAFCGLILCQRIVFSHMEAILRLLFSSPEHLFTMTPGRLIFSYILQEHTDKKLEVCLVLYQLHELKQHSECIELFVQGREIQVLSQKVIPTITSDLFLQGCYAKLFTLEYFLILCFCSLFLLFLIVGICCFELLREFFFLLKNDTPFLLEEICDLLYF